MKFNLLFFAFLTMIFWSCQNTTESEPEDETAIDEPQEEPVVDPSNTMVGYWETQEMTIYIQTKDGTDENDTLVATKDNFLEQTGVKTARGHYLDDGTFTDEYYNGDDSLFSTSEGTWSLMGDTLINTYDDTTAPYQYVVSFPDESTCHLSGWLDWDHDGERDDLMVGVSKRVGSQ